MNERIPNAAVGLLLALFVSGITLSFLGQHAGFGPMVSGLADYYGLAPVRVKELYGSGTFYGAGLILLWALLQMRILWQPTGRSVAVGLILLGVTFSLLSHPSVASLKAESKIDFLLLCLVMLRFAALGLAFTGAKVLAASYLRGEPIAAVVATIGIGWSLAHLGVEMIVENHGFHWTSGVCGLSVSIVGCLLLGWILSVPRSRWKVLSKKRTFVVAEKPLTLGNAWLTKPFLLVLGLAFLTGATNSAVFVSSKGLVSQVTELSVSRVFFLPFALSMALMAGVVGRFEARIGTVVLLRISLLSLGLLNGLLLSFPRNGGLVSVILLAVLVGVTQASVEMVSTVGLRKLFGLKGFTSISMTLTSVLLLGSGVGAVAGAPEYSERLWVFLVLVLCVLSVSVTVVEPATVSQSFDLGDRGED